MIVILMPIYISFNFYLFKKFTMDNILINNMLYIK